jgi:Domain of unknown function (DUF4232)
MPGASPRWKEIFDMTLRSGRGRRASAATGLGAAGVAAALLTGCGSNSPTTGTGASPTATATSSATAAPTDSASTAPAGPSPSASAPTGTAGTPACRSSGLRLSLGSVSGTAGSVYRYIEFKNVSAAACTLHGFPGVSLLGGSPARQIGAAATRAPHSRPSLVTLAPGKTASALLRIADAGDYPQATCHPAPATMLRVYPPNQTAPLTVRDPLPGCDATTVKLLQVNAVQPGTGNPPGAAP